MRKRLINIANELQREEIQFFYGLGGIPSFCPIVALNILLRGRHLENNNGIRPDLKVWRALEASQHSNSYLVIPKRFSMVRNLKSPNFFFLRASPFLATV